MKIVLRNDLEKVGKRGDIVQVADGYARNYLIPRGHAIVATKGIATQAAAMRRSRDLRDAKDRESAEVVAQRLVATTLRIEARVGVEGKLFGSVTAHDIADAIGEQTGATVDRKQIHLTEPLKTAGAHQVPIRLHSEVNIQLNVEVVAATE